MRTPRRSDLLLVTSATVLAAVLAVLDGQGWLEWVFGAFMLSCLGLLLRLGVQSWRSARAERRRAESLAATRPSAVAARAVAQERARLADEIETSIRMTLGRVAEELAGLDEASPVPGLRRMHELTRRATSELRRQLGLLRDDEGDQVERAGAAPRRRLDATRRGFLVGLAMAALGAVESSVYLLSDGPAEQWPWSAAFTAIAAATTGAHRRPQMGALAFSGTVAAGSVAGYPVTGGFWLVITLGVLTWSLAAAALARPAHALTPAATVATLVGVVIWAVGRDDPGNLGVTLLVLAVALAGGLLVGIQRRGQARARHDAEAREQLLGQAADAAVRADRAVVARELHDVVSHAVGVIAVQAGAAELSWPQDPEAVRRAVDVIRATTAEALCELDRLPSARDAMVHRLDDLLGLVDRVRRAGTAVDLVVLGDPSPRADLVHRLVQESLTNAMRHAPGAVVTVRITSEADCTEVWVRDDGPGPVDAATLGYGLVGLAERVELVHGVLDCGAGSDGRGFLVHATLPHHQLVRTP